MWNSSIRQGEQNTCLFKVLALAVSLSLLAGSSVAEENQADAFGQFYLERRESLQGVTDLPREERLVLLREIEEAAEQASGSPYHGSALFWVAQQYSSSGSHTSATRLFRNIAESPEFHKDLSSMARMELGRSLLEEGRIQEAEAFWFKTLNNPNEDLRVRSNAIGNLQSMYLSTKNWPELQKVSKRALELDIGETPVSYENFARAASRQNDFELAERYYSKLLSEYPEYRSENRMIYINKAEVTCRYENDKSQLGYLESMTEICDEYEKRAADRGELFAEVYAELSQIGMGYAHHESLCQERMREPDIAKQAAQKRALKLFERAIEGFKELPDEIKGNIPFDGCVTTSYFESVEILEDQGRLSEAIRILEEFLREFADIDPDMLRMAQNRLTHLLRGSLTDDSLESFVLTDSEEEETTDIAFFVEEDSEQEGVTSETADRPVSREELDTKARGSLLPSERGGMSMMLRGLLFSFFLLMLVVVAWGWRRRASRHEQPSSKGRTEHE